MIITLPSLLNVGALFTLVLFIYSILGNFLFKNVKEGSLEVREFRNFWNFHNSILSLFVYSTGENWPNMMYDCGRTSDCVDGVNCGSDFSVFFFLTFTMMATTVMLNLFVLIILNDFEAYNLKDDNPVELFKENLENFRSIWA